MNPNPEPTSPLESPSARSKHNPEWPVHHLALRRTVKILLPALALVLPGTIFVLLHGFQFTPKTLALLLIPGGVVVVMTALRHSVDHLRFLQALSINLAPLHPGTLPVPKSAAEAETTLLFLTDNAHTWQPLPSHTESRNLPTSTEALLTHRILADEQTQSAMVAELHDTVAQSLIAAQWLLETGKPDHAGALNHIKSAEKQLRDILAHAVLPDLSCGVAQLTKDLLTDLEARHGLTVLIEDWPTTQISLTSTAAITLHRFHQEAFANVIKHAGTKEATLKLEHMGTILRSTVTDNGTGFTLQNRDRHNLGLTTMEIRARSCGGRTELFTAPGQGTRLTLTIPITG